MPLLSSLLVICLGVFGLAWIIADSKISFPIRKILARYVGETSMLLTLLECPACLSFWLGLFTGLGLGYGILSVFIGFATTAFSAIVWAFIHDRV